MSLPISNPNLPANHQDIDRLPIDSKELAAFIKLKPHKQYVKEVVRVNDGKKSKQKTR